MRLPNLNLLRAFDASARHRNFRLAAEELHVTQGAVAQQIRRLEADLGQVLFLRQARGVALTRAGEAYHARIGPAMAELIEATRALQAGPARLVLSVPPSFASKWLVPRLPGFAEAHGGIEVHLVASEGLSDFSADGVELAIRQGRGRFDDALHAELLAPLDLCAVASPALVGARAIAGPQDCAGLRLIEDGHRHWHAAGLAAGAQLLRFNQTALAIDAAIGGQGVALAPRILVGEAIGAGLLRQLWQDTGDGGYFLVWPRSRPLGEGAQAMVAWLRQEMGV